VGGGTPIPIGNGLEVDTTNMMIIATGAFGWCEWSGRRAPNTGDLVEAGVIRELAERLHPICLPPLSTADLIGLFRARPDLPALQAMYADLGYGLEVSDGALGRVAWAVTVGLGGIGPRGGMGLITHAVMRRLADLLRTAAPPGTRIVLAPDDIALPLRDEDEPNPWASGPERT
jgi:hypothetical protein